MIQFKAETIALDSVDTSVKTYQITTRININDLTASIKAVGLINPPILARIQNQWIVISGFRRIAAARRLQFTEVDVRIVNTDKPLKIIEIAVADNALQRDLNLIEISRALNLLSTVCTEPEKLSESALRLGIPHHLSLIDRLIGLCRLPVSIQEAIIAGSISMVMANELSLLEPCDAELLSRLFVDLKMGLNTQREILVTTFEIAARDNRSIRAVFQDKEVRGILDNPEVDRVIKVRLLRRYLKQVRYPSITKAEDAFEQFKDELNLDAHLNLLPPKNFEGLNYHLNLTFDSRTELRKLNRQIERLLDHPSAEKHIPD